MVRWLMLLTLALALIAACGSSDDDPTRTTNQAGSPASTAAATTQPATGPAATNAAVDAAPPDIQVVTYTLGEPESSGIFYVYGYVENAGASTAQQVQVIASFYDAAGAILGSSESSVPLVITAGGQAPFTAYVQDVEQSAVSETRIQTQFEPYDPASFEGAMFLTTFDVPQINWTGSGWTGEVTNTGTVGAHIVAVYAAALDANGDVIVVSFAYTDLDALAPGAMSPFSIHTAEGFPAPASTIAYAFGYVD